LVSDLAPCSATVIEKGKYDFFFSSWFFQASKVHLSHVQMGSLKIQRLAAAGPLLRPHVLPRITISGMKRTDCPAPRPLPFGLLS
jgi:hypothetical protein